MSNDALVPSKLCANRIAPGKELSAIPVRWCVRPMGHEGECSAPIRKPVPSSDWVEWRLKGLKRDAFADAAANRHAGVKKDGG